MSAPMQAFLDAAWWPRSALVDGLEALAAETGLRDGDAASGVIPPLLPGESVGAWLCRAAARSGLEAVPASALVSDLPELLLHGGPAVIEIACRGALGFVLLTGRRGRHPVFRGPQRRRVDARLAEVAQWLSLPLDQRVRPEVERILQATGIPAGRRSIVADAMVRQRIGGEEVGGITIIRTPATASFTLQLRHAGVFGRLAAILGLFILLYGSEIGGWGLIGSATLSGRMDWGWLVAWLLLLLTMVPWRLLAGWNEAKFALDIGRLVKARLLAGALALPPDVVKRSGVGQLIGQVMESEALQSLVLGGGLAVVVAIVELGFAAAILAAGAAPRAHLALLFGVGLLTLTLGWAYNRRIASWTVQRLGMTDYLIEAMVGHRTRLAQERAARRNAAEDAQLATYLDRSATMDAAGLRLGAGIGMVWSVAALLAFVPALVAADAPAPAALAISLGGIMLAQRALGGVSAGLASLSRAGFAWRRVADIFRAGSQTPRSSGFAVGDSSAAIGTTVLDARNLCFGYGEGRAAVLDRASLSIAHGDRILIEGPSGGGKSTFAGLLTGLRLPDAGLLLLGGLDRPTLGDDWHRQVAASPQFHENHVFSGTLAFNLLMGRHWPPSEADLEEATSLCTDLGLGALLERMPGGIHQRVGETGWQLSHGERSRIFLARALLQKAEVTVLDESFGSLDPATMDQCLRTALDRCATLVVIAHP